MEPVRWLAAGSLTLAYAAFCARQWRLASRRSRLADAQAAAGWTVVYASQTGAAEALARQTARALAESAVDVGCCPLNQLDAARLEAGGRFLFVVSTAGQGDAPDNGALFAETVLDGELDLSRVDFALLALGDRDYTDFCAFGRRLESWLVGQGARRCFDRIDVHRCDPQAVADWQSRLGQLAGAVDFADAGGFSRWTLVDRRHLNSGSPGGEVHLLAFATRDGAMPTWASGDLVQVAAAGDPGRLCDYSIASLPDEGVLKLLVRLHRGADGTPGRVSGWLTQGLAVGDEVALRLCPHRSFQLNGNCRRPLICIGNGVGLAGLRGHLAARLQADTHDNWLLFGERTRAHDFHLQAELEGWHATGRLARLDTVFSRDGGACRYVQHALRANGDVFREWIARGAAVYVCGSRAGMADGVDRVIRDLLGAEGYRQLLLDERYCRDVF